MSSDLFLDAINLAQKENRISKKDWHGLMQIFLDYTVRSNESVFLKMDEMGITTSPSSRPTIITGVTKITTITKG